MQLGHFFIAVVILFFLELEVLIDLFASIVEPVNWLLWIDGVDRWVADLIRISATLIA